MMRAIVIAEASDGKRVNERAHNRNGEDSVGTAPAGRAPATAAST